VCTGPAKFIDRNPTRREDSVTIVVIMQGKPYLLQIVLALSSSGSFPSLLHRRKQQRDQHGDNRDHNQQFNQRKSAQGF
jgi:hypothetical protein